MMEATMGHRRTGLSRAKRIERLTLWLGLPLLLVLLMLAAGVVNYTPVRHGGSAARVDSPPAKTAPVEEAAPTIPMRRDRLVPLEGPDDLGQNIQLEDTPSVS